MTAAAKMLAAVNPTKAAGNWAILRRKEDPNASEKKRIE